MPDTRPRRRPTSVDVDRDAVARDLERAAADLAGRALQRLKDRLPWYRAMRADLRSWIGVVLQTTVTSFAAWYRDQSRRAINPQVFGDAPPELIRTVRLERLVQMTRVAIDGMDEALDDVVPDTAAADVHEAMLRYSREIAFAAATVYARAAEDRGAWDARLEALVVDAVLRDEAGESVRSQAAALRWPRPGAVAVVVGPAPQRDDPETVVDSVRASARSSGHLALVGVHGDRLVVLLDKVTDPISAATAIVDQFGAGPVVVGPSADTLASAGASAQLALAALRAAPGWPGAPRPVAADDLLPERVLAGDEQARTTLAREVYSPLAGDHGPLLETIEAYLCTGCSIEGAARRLLVHPNTVRYRLRRAHDICGWSVTDARGQYVLRVAITLGRMAGETPVDETDAVVGLLQRHAE